MSSDGGNGTDTPITPPSESPALEAGEAKKKEELPPLSPAEFRVFNRLAEKMDYFHNHFRSTWNMMYNACVNNKRPANMSLKKFIDEGLMFIQYLTAHHDIEETYMFPMLAEKMPEFQKGRSELMDQHRQIHAGMDVFEDYLRKCRGGETELDLRSLKEQMDTWGTILWTHLDQEVKTLGAENMRRYWSIGDMKAFRI